MEGDPIEDVLAAATGAVSWSVRGFSVVKPKNDVFGQGDQAVTRPNEDRFRVAETGDGLLAAVSDGAGSSGLYCGQWAQALVDHLPDTPFPNRGAVDPWMGGFWKQFADEAKRLAADAPTRHTKLIREGSCATLSVCWLRRTDAGVTLHWMGYGDSPLCVFEWRDGQPALISSHPGSLAKFDQAPFLLNWKDVPHKDHIRGGVVHLPPQATVMLASDGIGQFVLLRYLSVLSALGADAILSAPARALLEEFRKIVQTSGSKLSSMAQKHLLQPHGSAATFIAELRAAMTSEATFASLVRAWNEHGLMPNDDATLVIIDVETLEPEPEPEPPADTHDEIPVPSDGDSPVADGAGEHGTSDGG